MGAIIALLSLPHSEPPTDPLSNADRAALPTPTEHAFLSEQNVSLAFKPHSELLRLEAFDPAVYADVEALLEDEILQRALSSLTKSNPAAAAHFLLELPLDQRAGTFRSLAIEWGKKHPASAIDWFQTNKAGLTETELQSAIDPLWQGYARTNPAEAQSQLEADPNSEPSEAFYAALAEGWANSDPRTGLAWLGTLNENTLPATAINDAYVALARAHILQDPTFALELAESLESTELRSELLPEIAKGLAEENLEAAVSWAKTIESPATAGDALSSLIATLDPADDSQALAITLEFTHLFESESTVPSQALSLLAYRNPELIAKQATNIPANARSLIGSLLAEHCADRQNPPEWVAQLPPGPILDQVAQSIALSSASGSPQNAIRWASRIGDAQHSLDTFEHLVDSSDPENRLELADAIGASALSPEEKATLIQALDKRSNHAVL